MEYTARMVKNGNIKIGNTMWSWNKLAGDGEIAGCKGTCGKHCTGCYNKENPQKSPCYVFKSYVTYGWDHSSVVKGHIRNTNIMRKNMNQAFKEIQLQLNRARKKPSAVRIHASGEIETAEELMKWIETAKMFPQTPFYVYTKAYDVLHETFCSIDTGSIPSNLFINVSIWHEHGIATYNEWKHLDCIRAFVYMDGFDYSKYGLKIDCICPAYRKDGNGKVKLYHDMTCDKCKICFQSKAKVCGCFDH